MLADEVRLDLVARTGLQGRKAVGTYFHNYAHTSDWRFALGFVDGRPAAIACDPDDRSARPLYFVLLGWADGQLLTIRDFRYARYAVEGAEISRARLKPHLTWPPSRYLALRGMLRVRQAATGGISGMTQLIVILFAITYVGMALGRVPCLRVDRAGIAMIVAVVLVAVGAVPIDGLTNAIHFPTLLLLGGLMILSARVGASGFYDAAAVWIAGQAGRPLLLLAVTIAVGGALSALLVNDIVVFAMTPLLCAGLTARGLDPRPICSGWPPPAMPARPQR